MLVTSASSARANLVPPEEESEHRSLARASMTSSLARAARLWALSLGISSCSRRSA